MNLNFIYEDHEQVILDDTHISNGHWIIDRAAVTEMEGTDNHDIYEQFEPILNYGKGRYDGRLSNVRTMEKSILEMVKYSDEGYIEANLTAEGYVKIRPASIEIRHLVIRPAAGPVAMKVRINPYYARLTRLGRLYVKGETDPILVKDGGQLVAMIMPMVSEERDRDFARVTPLP